MAVKAIDNSGNDTMTLVAIHVGEGRGVQQDIAPPGQTRDISGRPLVRQSAQYLSGVRKTAEEGVQILVQQIIQRKRILIAPLNAGFGFPHLLDCLGI